MISWMENPALVGVDYASKLSHVPHSKTEESKKTVIRQRTNRWIVVDGRHRNDGRECRNGMSYLHYDTTRPNHNR